MASDPKRVQAVFLQAVELHAADRDAVLDQECGDDLALRQRVEALLQAHDEPGSFLERPAVDPVATGDAQPREVGTDGSGGAPPVEGPGTRIGPYKLLEQIGEGGFGVVFMAEQQHPVRRKVALKVIKPGMDTRQVVARFEAERQALALMDHPHIAHIFDGGETASGRPYFVMELVRGIPITEFCDQNHLPVRARLELYVTVCQAVQHAHQRGIIHRDLKPSNVLVTLHDDKAVVKVIDFGIAKATGQQLTEKTLFTNFAQMIGTPLYMSPEQAQLSGLDIDTRSDIYSLGVLLYELLTGTTPFDQERLRTAAYEEIRRIIREEEPAKPSTRISTLGQAATGVSANRKSDPRRLAQVCRGELDWIVMKALEKDRNRRYESASAFAADVQRYLHDEPVHACPPSSWYRLRKFARRNKRMAFLTAAAILLLLAATGVSSYFAIQADQRARDAFAQKERADENAAKAQANLGIAYEVLDKIYLNMAERRLPQQQALTPEDREFLQDALRFYEQLAGKQGTEPPVRQQTAVAYLRISNIRSELGHYGEAKENYRQALALFEGLVAEFPDDPDYRHNLARCLCGVVSDVIWSHFDTEQERETAFRQAVRLQERLASEFPARADYQRELGDGYCELGRLLQYNHRHLDEADKLLRRAVAIHAKLVEEHPTVPQYRQDLGKSLGNLGLLLQTTYKVQEADAVVRRSLDVHKKLVDDFPGLPYARLYLGWGYRILAELFIRNPTRSLEDAEENCRHAVAVFRKLVDDFPGVGAYRSNLAFAHGTLAEVRWRMGRVQEAAHAYRDSLTIYEGLVREYPAEDSASRRVQEAFYAYRDSLTTYEGLNSAFRLGLTQCLLGHLEGDQGQPEPALAWYEQAIATFQRVCAKKPTDVLARVWLTSARGERAEALIRLGRFKEPESAYLELEQSWQEAIQRDPSDHLNWYEVAPLRLRRGDLEGYRRVCREMLARFSHTDDPMIAERTAKTCLLVPDAVGDLGLVLELADRAVTGTEQIPVYDWFLLARGMADYRAGHFANAIDCLNKVLFLNRETRYRSSRSLSATAQLFLAMAHHRLGLVHEARHALNQATELMEQPCIFGAGCQHPNYPDWLRFHVVRSEAERLVKGQAEPPK